MPGRDAHHQRTPSPLVGVPIFVSIDPFLRSESDSSCGSRHAKQATTPELATSEVMALSSLAEETGPELVLRSAEFRSVILASSTELGWLSKITVAGAG